MLRGPRRFRSACRGGAAVGGVAAAAGHSRRGSNQERGVYKNAITSVVFLGSVLKNKDHQLYNILL